MTMKMFILIEQIPSQSCAKNVIFKKENINSKSFTVICKPLANNKGNSNAISSMSKLMQYNPWLLSHMPLKMKSTTLPKAWCYNVISLSR